MLGEIHLVQRARGCLDAARSGDEVFRVETWRVGDLWVTVVEALGQFTQALETQAVGALLQLRTRAGTLLLPL